MLMDFSLQLVIGQIPTSSSNFSLPNILEIKTRLTPRAADGANAPLGSVTLPATARSGQAALPIRPAANAFRWAAEGSLHGKIRGER